MNGKNLLIGLSYIDRKYIEESERDLPARRSIRPGRKVWLIAAVLALTLALVGCAVAVYTRIHMKVVQHHMPTTAAATSSVMHEPVQETLPVKDPLTGCYPQSLPAGYQMGEGEQLSHHSRRIEYRNDEGKSVSFRISTYEPANITLAPPMEKITMKVSGYDAVLQVTELGAQAFTWYNEAEGYYASFYTDDMTVDLQALAESVEYGSELPLTFLCREGKVWNPWYPQQLPEGYACRQVSAPPNGTQVINYSNGEYGITYAISLTTNFLEEATEPPHDSFAWEDLTIAGQTARMMTTPGQRILYWQNVDAGFYAMLIAADADVDIVALAESTAPGAVPTEPSMNLGPDYTIELEQEKSAYVGWEPVYPQWVPEEYEISFVSDPAYGQQAIVYESAIGDTIVYTFYFRLGDWGKQFDGMGQPEEVTVNGNPGYRLGNSLIWTDEAKGFGFVLDCEDGADLMTIAESVGLGPELEPTNADKTTKALAELGDYQIMQLPKGMAEDSVTGLPLEDGGDWYSYVRRWYIDQNTNVQIYFEYETYVAEPAVTAKKIVQNFMGDRPIEFCTVSDCTGAISQDDSNAAVVWIQGNGKQGVVFRMVSSDFSAQELLTMAQSVQKKQ